MAGLLVQTIAGVTSRPVVAPVITILEWAKRLRIVSFLVALPPSQQIVTLTATLTATNKKTTVAEVSAVNANVVTGVQLPPVPSGKYTLTLAVADNRGGAATVTRKVEVTT